jgi:hypothetical protein
MSVFTGLVAMTLATLTWGRSVRTAFSAIAYSVTNALGRDVHFIPKVKDSWKSLHTLLNAAKSRVRGQRCVPQDRRLSTVIRLLTTVPPYAGALLLLRCHFPPVEWSVGLTDEAGHPALDRGGVRTSTVRMLSPCRGRCSARVGMPLRGSEQPTVQA